MKIAIIGGGYTGLAASYYLSRKKGAVITVFEKENFLGGLASGFKDKGWSWSLDKYYHHIFTSDSDILKLAEELNCHLVYIKPKTSIFYAGKTHSFDSALDLLLFPYISLVARLRTGLTIIFLKLVNNWKPLEKITAEKFIQNTSGYESWKIIWHHLFSAKFGKASKNIPASWFWSRIKKRGRVFGYPEGGFDVLTNAIVKQAKKRKVKFLLNTEVKSMAIHVNKFTIKTNKGSFTGFDKVICTLPAHSFVEITPDLPRVYTKKLMNLKGRGTINLIISLKKQFLSDGTYWLNINDKKFPFIGIVEQTNFISKNKYNNDNIIHIVNYLSPKHLFFKADKKYLIKKFFPYLKKINSEFNESWIKKSWIFKSGFAQPIMGLNYSKIIPSIETPIKNIYLANMQQVYPWDRQTNYAVTLGKKVSEIILKSF